MDTDKHLIENTGLMYISETELVLSRLEQMDEQEQQGESCHNYIKIKNIC